MKTLLVPGCVVLLLVDAVCLAHSPALGEKDVGNVPRRAFEEFRKLFPKSSNPDKSPRPAPIVTWRPTFWQCSDGETTLTIDVRGNASCKRVVGWSPPLPPTKKGPKQPAAKPVDDESLIRKTRDLATPWLAADHVRSLKTAVKREILVLAGLPEGSITEIPGRTIVRLFGADGNTGEFFQGVFDPKGDLLRVDIAFSNARTKDFCELALLARATPSMKAAVDQPLTLGCFFDPDEYRFEISALSVEGEPFLKIDKAANPFARDNFDMKLPHRVSAKSYRESKDYHWWCWTWWNQYGHVGGFRGNWLEKEGKGGWEHPLHEVRHHRSLAFYETVQGPPKKTIVIKHPDAQAEYPHAVSQVFKPAFYKDLEECNVAFFFTHGGPIKDYFQIRRRLDEWVVVAPPGKKLGAGKLRHLFFDGCAACTYRREPESAHLVKTWIQRAPVNGVRTVCGVDGRASLLDRCGWRFFGYYNKGDSISDSWNFALLDEWVDNCAATVAYGKSRSEAIESLLAGRFSADRAEAKAVAISVWTGPSQPKPAEK